MLHSVLRNLVFLKGFLQPPAGGHVRSSSLARECSRSPLSSSIKSETETADNAPARSSQSRGSCAHLPQTALSGEADWAGPGGSHLISRLCSKSPRELLISDVAGKNCLPRSYSLCLPPRLPPTPINYFFFCWQCSIAENSGVWEGRWIVYESSCSLLTRCSVLPSLHFPFSPTSKTQLWA